MKSSMCTLLRREDSSPRELNSHDLASIDRYPAKKQFSLHTVQCTSDLFKRYNAFTELVLHWSIGLNFCAIFGIPSCHCFRSVSGVAMATDTVATFTKKMNIDTHIHSCIPIKKRHTSCPHFATSISLFRCFLSLLTSAQPICTLCILPFPHSLVPRI